MDIRSREATRDDLDAIAALTRGLRYRLAGWSPQWWQVAEGADELHPLWLGHLISSDDAEARVFLADDEIVATAIATEQRDTWFIDDIAIAEDGLWSDVAPELVGAFSQRPAATCVAVGDDARTAAFAAAGLTVVSSIWIAATDVEDSASMNPSGAARSSARSDTAPHTFGGSFDPTAPGALVIEDECGTAVGSPSTYAPPVYGPGGTVTVIDRLHGSNLDAVLSLARTTARARGDVLLAVVCAPDNDDLAGVLGDHGFVRTVEVHRWPSAS